MAIRKIVYVGDELLKQKCKPVVHFNQFLWDLLDDMRETMYKNIGMGLAGPQVGILKRVAIVEVNNMFLELVNPVILSSSGNEEDEEACLSVPNRRGLVARPTQITVRAQDRFGNFFTITGEDLFARCVCHELDHLDGILYIDKMTKEIKEEKWT